MPRKSAVPDEPADLTATLEWLPLADLRSHPRNYQTHPEAELAHIRQSLLLHGYYRNLVIAQDATLLAGHGVWQAAQQLGWTHGPVQRLPYAPDDPQALQIVIGDNEMVRLAQKDNAALAALVQDLHDWDPTALLGTGFDIDTLALLSTAGQASSEATAPESFPVYDEDIATAYCCPKCGYAWSGKPA